jgi:hypothetical protein
MIDLDKTKHICSEENIKIMLTNTNKLIEFNEQIMSTIKCYEDSQPKTKDPEKGDAGGK